MAASKLLRDAITRIEATPRTRRAIRKGTVMMSIAKIIESTFTKDAAQPWTCQTSALASRSVWSWGGADGTSTVF